MYMYSLSRDIYGNQFIFIDINPIHLNHYSSQVQPEAQESGDCVHHDTRELGVRSGKNDSRDFWKFNDIPVVPCQRKGGHDILLHCKFR